MFMANMLTRMGKLPKWKYVRGVNTIMFTLPKKTVPDWGKLLVAIVSAVILGLAIRILPPDDVSHPAADLLTDLRIGKNPAVVTIYR
jgi:hypothetical protein